MIFQEFRGRCWRFGACEFDESSRLLTVHGRPVDVESKPLDVLQQLLVHPGEVVTKEELLEAVWPGVTVVEGSLATAVSKLRKALGETDETPLIVTVPRIGYRLAVPVQSRLVEPPPLPELHFSPGDAVPGREQWLLHRALDRSGSSEVWLGEHPKTREQRVFKFASDGVRLKGLKREVTVARILRESLGERPEFVRLLEWNFDSAPYFLESEFCGQNLAEWAEARGGLPAIPVAERLDLAARLAEAVGLAHSSGVLHKDLKPANVLMAGTQLKVADFGSAALLDPERLRSLGITNLGFTQTVSGDHDLTGTLLYLPPEVLAGQPATAAADVYALGVLLYQLLAGDFRKPLAPGWEAEVADPLLREDIAAAAHGDPASRLPSAAILAERLRTLEPRRASRRAVEEAEARARAAEQSLATARARRPWVIAAALILTVGLAVSLFLYRRASQQTEIASAVNRFLAQDLLGRTDPFQSGKSGESFSEAVEQAVPQIDRQFAGSPAVAARLHHAVARAFDNRTNWPAARREYDRAAALYGPGDDALIVGLQRAAMEARTYEQGSLERARGILASLQPQLGNPSPEAAVWLASARGMVALIGNDATNAAREFQAAVDGAERLPAFDENARLTLRQRLAFTAIRLGDAPRAERLFRELIAAFTRSRGAESPAVLRVRLNLAQAYMIGHRHEEAVRETTEIYPAYVSRLGEDHELALQVLTTRAQSEGALGRWDAAARDGLRVHALAVKKQGPQSFFAVAALSDAALAECRGGHWAEGSAHARQAYEASSRAFGPRAGLTGGTAYTLASCSIGRGELAPAAALLKDIDIKAVSQLAGDPNWFAGVELALAEIAHRQGDAATARRHLAVAAPVFAKPEAEPYQKEAVARLTAALESH